MESSSNENELAHFVIDSENLLKGNLYETGSLTKVVENETTQQKKTECMEQEPKQEYPLKSPNFSGVTIRKKLNCSKTTLLGQDNEIDNGSKAINNSPGTCLSSLIPPKFKPVTHSTGILKLSTSSNIHSEKKVKFNGGYAANTNMEKTSSLRKVETSDNVQKTAIKKRIFIPSKKPTNNPKWIFIYWFYLSVDLS